MPRKPRPKKKEQDEAAIEEAQRAIFRYHQSLHMDFALELQCPKVNWERLSAIHLEILDVERRVPWLQTEAA